MLLTRKSEGQAQAVNPIARAAAALGTRAVDRRTFLKGTGLTAGAAAFASQLPLNLVGEANAQAAKKTGNTVVRRTVCTHCSVGCAIDAVVTDGVWVRQEPVFDSPINLGAHCAKGAAVREHGMTEHSHRLKYPMKLVAGKYRRISWETAINEIGDKLLAIRKESGPDEPIQNTASGPLSLRIESSLSPISLIASSQLMRRYFPSTSFIGYLRRCE